MTYSIIGSGNVGTALARHFARNGIDVAIANTRGPDTLAALAKELGEKIIPKTLQEALKADTVIFAIPFRAYREVARESTNWNGKIVIDAMNPYGVPPEELGGQPSSDLVAAALPGAKVVKAFNQLPAAVLGSAPQQNGGRRVVFVSSNHEDAAIAVVRLAEQLGFAPISLGKIAEGGLLLQLGAPLVLKNLIKQG
ncbi:MAG: NADPH-dependent F420 reductase [Collimonas sp.]|uniref:NADPH-dependent F420 reductase n=1 Tax=Collimonas sp. TaxID=1963772 RepID=UPI00326334CF